MSSNKTHKRLNVTIALAQSLITEQFPQWAHLPISKTSINGWDNVTFRLGDKLLIRLPSAACYETQVAKEQYWLPRLAPYLSYAIPKPLAMGAPSLDYPFAWSIYAWLPGESANNKNISDKSKFTMDLASFINQLHAIKTNNAPLPGAHNFERGGSLKFYNKEALLGIEKIKNNKEKEKAKAIWQRALASRWQGPAVWVHGDLSANNILVENGHLSAVIDFGCMAVGDPACDLAIAWQFLDANNRQLLKQALTLDEATWERAHSWVLWKSVI